MESLQEKNISNQVCAIDYIPDWTQPIKDFILKEIVSENKKQARKICTISARYVLIEEQ